MQKTGIEWTNFTSNPLKYRDPDGNIVHACIHKSGGCRECYSETLAGRWGRKGMPFTAENMKRLTPFIDHKEIHSIMTHRPASGKMCFPFDMTDLFGEWVPFELIDHCFAAMILRNDVTFQVLTKRADRMLEYIRSRSPKSDMHTIGSCMYALRPELFNGLEHTQIHWPAKNIWFGVSAEDQKTLDERFEKIAQIHDLGWTTFASLEPLLGPITFWHNTPEVGLLSWLQNQNFSDDGPTRAIDWAIVGGESGPDARPFDLVWARDIAFELQEFKIPMFMKQYGRRPIDSQGIFGIHAEHDKRSIQAMQDLGATYVNFNLVLLKDHMGGDMLEWEEGLRIREFPVAKCG